MTPCLEMRRLGKELRLAKPRDFGSVKRGGVSARSGKIMVAALSGNRRRLGIVVARRVGNAVQRNRLKRVIREYFRNNRQEFPMGDCVVIPGSSAGQLDNEELRASLGRALSLLAQKL